MKRISPCLWFVDKGEEAANLYTSLFKNSKTTKVSRYGDAGAEVSGRPKGSVMTVEIEIAGLSLQILNGGPEFQHTPATSLFVTCGSRDELDQIYQSLSPGGKVLMELGEYPFSPRYAFFSDKFGVHWQLILEEGAEQKIAPCIIFGGDKRGYGAKALAFYLTLFKNAQTLVDVRYPKGDPALEGTVMHARLQLDGSELVIMESGKEGSMPLTSAFSLTINCKDQSEVDYFWNLIGKSGKEIQCGWIEDQFGLSWQVVPEGIADLISGPDAKKAEQAMSAMLKMKKLDINKLCQAYTS